MADLYYLTPEAGTLLAPVITGGRISGQREFKMPCIFSSDEPPGTETIPPAMRARWIESALRKGHIRRLPRSPTLEESAQLTAAKITHGLLERSWSASQHDLNRLARGEVKVETPPETPALPKGPVKVVAEVRMIPDDVIASLNLEELRARVRKVRPDFDPGAVNTLPLEKLQDLARKIVGPEGTKVD